MRVSPKRGFTLIELLAVIAIIAILAALLIPAVGGAMDKGKTAKCKGGIKSIGSAVLLYAADHDGYLPPTYGYDGQGVDKGDFQNHVTNYLQDRASIWVCPSAKQVGKPDAATYAVHGEIFAYRDTIQRTTPGNGDYRPLRTTSSLRRPSQILCAADTCQIHNDMSGGPGLSDWTFDEDPIYADVLIDVKYPANLVKNTDAPDPNAAKVIRYRHDRQTAANGVFFDGHVEGFKTKTLKNRNIASKQY